MSQNLKMYLFSQLAEAARENFIRGKLFFHMFKSARVKIEHMHDNEWGVLVYDPVAKIWAECLRMVEKRGQLCLMA